MQNLLSNKLPTHEMTIPMTPCSLRKAQSTTKEASGKVRDISGWVIHEEIKSCISYVSQHKCSKSQKVVKEVADKRKMKAMLDQMKRCEDDVLEKSN